MWTYIEKKHIELFINQYPIVRDQIEELSLYESSDNVFLPRYIHLTYPSQFLKCTLGQRKVKEEHVQILFNGKLREEQKPIVNKILKIFNLNKNVNGIIKAFPGIGKTVLSIYLITKLNLKACIVVDNKNLVKQWVNAIIRFTNIEAGSIGLIQGNFFEIEDKPITIAMVQTLQSKLKTDFTKTFEKIDSGKFGIVFYDEVHKSSSAPQFSKSSLLFRTKNILGLSATPFHYGISEILMTRSIGKILYETNDYKILPKYYFLYYNSGLKGKELNKINYIQNTNIKRGIYNKIIATSKIYVDNVREQTEILLKNNHKIIIICSTQKQVELISQNLTDNGIVNRKFYGKENKLDREKDKVLVATYAYGGAGFDFKELSALILACPLSGKKSVIQVVGRILRKCENKKESVVIDMIDLAIPMFMLPMVKIKKKLIKEEFNCGTFSIQK